MKYLKSLFVAALLSFCACAAQGQSLVTFNLLSLTGQTNNRTITITADDHGQFFGSNFISETPIVLHPVNGVAVTNLLPDCYSVDIESIDYTFHMCVGTDGNPTNAYNLIQNYVASTMPIPAIAPGDNITFVTNVVSGQPQIVINGNASGPGGGTNDVSRFTVNLLTTNLFTTNLAVTNITGLSANQGVKIATGSAPITFSSASVSSTGPFTAPVLNSITANFSGLVTGGAWVGPGTNTASTNFLGSLSGDVTGTQGATVLSTNNGTTGNLFVRTNGQQSLTIGNSASVFTGSFNGPVSNGWANVLDYGAVGDGSTDDTAAFNLAMAQNKLVWVPRVGLAGSTNGYVVGNLTIAKHYFKSDGARLLFKAGVTNFMINFGVPSVFPSYATSLADFGNTMMEGFILDGGGGTNIPTTRGTRHAVWFDPYQTNSFFRDCTITGFSGYGLFQCSIRPVGAHGGTIPALPNNTWGYAANCHIFNCWEGVSLFRGNPPGINAPGDDYGSEYTQIYGMHCANNCIGIEVGTGNQYINGCNFDLNYTGLNLVSNVNNGHGLIEGCSFNHNITNGILATNIGNGMVFNGCTIYGSPTNYWLGCGGIIFQNGQLGNTDFTFDGGTLNTVRFSPTLDTVLGQPNFHNVNGGHGIWYCNEAGGVTVPDPIDNRLIPSTLTVTNLHIITNLTIMGDNKVGADTSLPFSICTNFNISLTASGHSVWSFGYGPSSLHSLGGGVIPGQAPPFSTVWAHSSDRAFVWAESSQTDLNNSVDGVGAPTWTIEGWIGIDHNWEITNNLNVHQNLSVDGSITGSGSGLTSIPAANLVGGPVPTNIFQNLPPFDGSILHYRAGIGVSFATNATFDGTDFKIRYGGGGGVAFDVGTNGNVSAIGTLGITGLATFNGGATVNGTSTLNGTTTVTGGTLTANANGVTNLPPNSPSYSISNSVPGTNIWPSLSAAGGGQMRMFLTLSNDLCVVALTNGPGICEIWLQDLGATNHLFLCPTQFICFPTNYFTGTSTSNWFMTLTNGHKYKIVVEDNCGLASPNGTNSSISIMPQ